MFRVKVCVLYTSIYYDLQKDAAFSLDAKSGILATCTTGVVNIYYVIQMTKYVIRLVCLCLFVHSGVQHILRCVFALFVFVLCTQCCQFLWFVHIGLPFRYSLKFICPVYPMLPVSLDCPYLIALSVFSKVYLALLFYPCMPYQCHFIQLVDIISLIFIDKLRMELEWYRYDLTNLDVSKILYNTKKTSDTDTDSP